ncbi:hypothetical protein GCK72_020489 [Caenorhabditis remanei]|uniref:L-Fucosyltransferase n=1 Tax=Caenorhabditis remanei TaxID=31234 RepID=A0A6A5GHE7_CAERE|nr:hypothetical protein GCK72_020489 [Caenorhabditis remanei]KAF1753932.1 hypothetical protein GCK72_020489 [Caenorhabditis remanei]
MFPIAPYLPRTSPALPTTTSMVTTKKIKKPNKYVSSNLAASSRLGNHLFELSALLAIARKLERIPTFFIIDHHYDQMLKDTDFVIPGLLDHFLIINESVPVSITPTDFQLKCCMWDDPDRLKNITDEYIHIRGTHYQSWKFFPRLRNELMGYLKTTKNKFPNLPKSSSNTFVTCVHIRRTDFVGSGFHVPDEKFILSAMQFVEQKGSYKLLQS